MAMAMPSTEPSSNLYKGIRVYGYKGMRVYGYEGIMIEGDKGSVPAEPRA